MSRSRSRRQPTGRMYHGKSYDILDSAHDGEAIAVLGREFGLTPAQTQSVVAALLPAISSGLKQSTSTVDGLGNLFAVMGQQQDLHPMYDDPDAAFGSEGLAAGNDALSVIFGSPDASRQAVDQAQRFSGVSWSILKKLLPVLAGIIISGLMRSGSSGRSAAPGAPAPSEGSGGLGDILGQIFGRGCPARRARPPVPRHNSSSRQSTVSRSDGRGRPREPGRRLARLCLREL